MKVSRRSFLKMILAGTGLAGAGFVGWRLPQPEPLPGGVAAALDTPVPPTSQAVRPTADGARASLPAMPRGTPAGVPPAATLGPTVAPTVPVTPTLAPTLAPTAATTKELPRALSNRPQRQMWAWLRMSGTRVVPTSEDEYGSQAEAIDAALPLNGGKLQADGTWLQEDWKLHPHWPQGLPARARQEGHLYMPAVGNDPEGLLKVLDRPRDHDRVAADLVAGATGGRFDAPWDGVYLDIEAVPAEYRQKMTQLLARLGRAVKDAGLQLGISVGGAFVDGRPATDPAYDLSIVRELADFVDLRCYEYWGPPPRSVGPYWWMEGVIQHGLKSGLSAKKLLLGQANYSRYWPDSRRGQSQEMTYVQAMNLVRNAGVQDEWVESNERGTVRERLARVGGGHVWIHDGDTLAAGLRLVDQYGLRGAALFAPGMGDAREWEVVRAWRAGQLKAMRGTSYARGRV